EFEPSASDANAIGAADVVFASGAGLDDWAGDLIQSSGGPRALVKGDPHNRLLQGEGKEAGGPDPHFWHDPTLVKKAVRTIATELAKADPGGATGYEKRAADYAAQLDDLDTELRTAYGAIPAEKRKMVTDHDALNYLARR